jgi:uncharacterized iron-regulated membrane protein
VSASRQGRQRRWPHLPPRLIAKVLAGHSAVGLVFGALIFLVCVTGTLAVFVDELQLIEAPAAPISALAPAALNRAAANAVVAAGAPARAGVLFIKAPLTGDQRWTAFMGDQTWRIDARGGLTPLKTPWTDFVAHLHMTLALPAPWGSALVGMVGAALLSLILSGVLAHPRILRDAFVLRLGGAHRLQEADLHNRLSVWGLPFHVAVTLTGALFALANILLLAVAGLGFHGDGGPMLHLLEGPAVAADPRPAPLPALQRLAARAEQGRPGAQLSYIGIERPGTAGQRVTVEVSAPGRLPRGDQTYFDGRGQAIGEGRFASGALGLQLYSGAAQVHFGFFGGLPVRIAYGVLGAALSYVSATGVSIWLARRRDQGRPAPRLERAWAGWTWGVPFALALAALLSRWAPVQDLFWGAALLIQAAVQLVGPRPPLTPSRARTPPSARFS